MKEFFKSPKNTTILGLVSMCILLFYNYSINGLSFTFWSMTHIADIGIIIYLAIVALRLYNKKINIVAGKNILIIGTIIQIMIILYISNSLSLWSILAIISIIYYLVLCLYFCNITFKKPNFMNNKIYLALTIIYIIVNILVPVIYNIDFSISNIFHIGDTISEIINTFLASISKNITTFCYLLIMPYFYNYYNWLKGANNNDK